MAGRLVLCATPIGNLEDASPRLAVALATADRVFAEDTRRTATLVRHLGIDVKLRSYFAGNEATRQAEIQSRVAAGETVALVTDAGMPSIADPGHSAVAAALAAGGDVTVVPGPSAVTAAVAVSGLASDRFVFEGFLPRKGRARTDRLAAIASEERTVVVFAAPARVARDLDDLGRAAAPERRIAVARELTKLHEEVWRGTISGAAHRWSNEVEPRGEFTLVIEGRQSIPPDMEDLVAEVGELVKEGSTPSDAVRVVAQRHEVSRRNLYREAITDPGVA